MTLWFRCSFGDLLKAVPAIQTDSKDIWLLLLLLASSSDALIEKSKFLLEWILDLLNKYL